MKILIYTLLFLFGSCSGPEGPQGPPGPVGGQGSVGQKGDKGDTGETGNANINSYTFINREISASNGLSLTLPAITETILESGLILGFIRISGTSVWYPLPYIEGNEIITIFSLKVETIHISSTVDTENVDIRIVVAEGMSNTNMRLKNLKLDLKDYDQLKNFFNLPE